MRNEIEDEEHFIIRCNKFPKEREELFELISSKVKYFTLSQDKQKLFWILNCEELEILNSLGRFLKNIITHAVFTYSFCSWCVNISAHFYEKSVC